MAEFLLYREPEEKEIWDIMIRITFDTENRSGLPVDEIRAKAAACVAHILSVSEKMGFKGNLWQDYLAYIIACNENAFSVPCERKGYMDGGINRAALHDM